MLLPQCRQSFINQLKTKFNESESVNDNVNTKSNEEDAKADQDVDLGADAGTSDKVNTSELNCTKVAHQQACQAMGQILNHCECKGCCETSSKAFN